jgi:integrase/recombinase XerC
VSPEIVEGVEGPARGILYLFSAFTGLWRKELASLTPRSLNLADETPTVTVAAAYAKNGREDKIPLPRCWLKVFSGGWRPKV